MAHNAPKNQVASRKTREDWPTVFPWLDAPPPPLKPQYNSMSASLFPILPALLLTPSVIFQFLQIFYGLTMKLYTTRSIKKDKKDKDSKEKQNAIK